MNIMESHRIAETIRLELMRRIPRTRCAEGFLKVECGANEEEDLLVIKYAIDKDKGHEALVKAMHEIVYDEMGLDFSNDPDEKKPRAFINEMFCYDLGKPYLNAVVKIPYLTIVEMLLRMK